MIDNEKVIENLEKAKMIIEKWVPMFEQYNTPFGIDVAIGLLKEPELEAKWIYGEDKTGVDGWYCSECNFFEPWFYGFTDDIDFIRFYEHCPSCGRKMTSYTGTPTQTGG